MKKLIPAKQTPDPAKSHTLPVEVERMAILLGCGEGLMMLEREWRVAECPLAGVTNIALEGGRIAALDNGAHQLWLGGEVLSAETGIESVRLWQGHCLTLSGDTDCLTLTDAATGELLLTTPVGVYPQDMCVLPNLGMVAVCGGADGTVRLLTLPDLTPVRTAHVPGNAQRIDASCGWLHVLCLTEDDGLQSLLCRVPIHERHGRTDMHTRTDWHTQTDRYIPVATLPGLPGAIRADSTGGLWTAASERLYHFPRNSRVPDWSLPGFGLIRHIDCNGRWVLVTDPVMGLCALIDATGRQPMRVLYEGDVGQGAFV